jgi:hypothetical protein
MASVSDEQEQPTLQREVWQEALERAIQVGIKIKTRRGNRPLTPPEEIIRQAREERNEQLTKLR